MIVSRHVVQVPKVTLLAGRTLAKSIRRKRGYIPHLRTAWIGPIADLR